VNKDVCKLAAAVIERRDVIFSGLPWIWNYSSISIFNKRNFIVRSRFHYV